MVASNMKTIKKVILSNFKRFKNLELEFDDELNILIGDNESGKSSVLLALDLTLADRDMSLRYRPNVRGRLSSTHF
jgi:predicted ATP-dependent endonuclease of OLD family